MTEQAKFLGEISFDVIYDTIYHIEGKFGKPIESVSISEDNYLTLLKLPDAQYLISGLHICGVPIFRLHWLNDDQMIVAFKGGSVLLVKQKLT